MTAVHVTKTASLSLKSGYNVAISLGVNGPSIQLTFNGSTYRDESWVKHVGLTKEELVALKDAIEVLIKE